LLERGGEDLGREIWKRLAIVIVQENHRLSQHGEPFRKIKPGHRYGQRLARAIG